MDEVIEFQRRVVFKPGYNYLHETGPQRRGKHGMEIMFVLIGSKGAAHFGINAGWTPRGVGDDQSLRSAVHPDHTHDENYGIGSSTFRYVNEPSVVSIGWHLPEPCGPWDEPWSNCEWLGSGRPCYGSARFSGSDGLLKAFIDKGDDPVWDALAVEYREAVARAEAYAAEVKP